MQALRIELSPRAWRDLNKFNTRVQGEILEAIRTLESLPWPGPPRVKKLKSKRLFRLRVGDYRCVFELARKEKVIVYRIVDRKDFERILKTTP